MWGTNSFFPPYFLLKSRKIISNWTYLFRQICDFVFPNFVHLFQILIDFPRFWTFYSINMNKPVYDWKLFHIFRIISSFSKKKKISHWKDVSGKKFSFFNFVFVHHSLKYVADIIRIWSSLYSCICIYCYHTFCLQINT